MEVEIAIHFCLVLNVAKLHLSIFCEWFILFPSTYVSDNELKVDENWFSVGFNYRSFNLIASLGYSLYVISQKFKSVTEYLKLRSGLCSTLSVRIYYSVLSNKINVLNRFAYRMVKFLVKLVINRSVLNVVCFEIFLIICSLIFLFLF